MQSPEQQEAQRLCIELLRFPIQLKPEFFNAVSTVISNELYPQPGHVPQPPPLLPVSPDEKQAVEQFWVWTLRFRLSAACRDGLRVAVQACVPPEAPIPMPLQQPAPNIDFANIPVDPAPIPALPVGSAFPNFPPMPAPPAPALVAIDQVRTFRGNKVPREGVIDAPDSFVTYDIGKAHESKNGWKLFVVADEKHVTPARFEEITAAPVCFQLKTDEGGEGVRINEHLLRHEDSTAVLKADPTFRQTFDKYAKSAIKRTKERISEGEFSFLLNVGSEYYEIAPLNPDTKPIFRVSQFIAGNPLPFARKPTIMTCKERTPLVKRHPTLGDGSADAGAGAAPGRDQFFFPPDSFSNIGSAPPSEEPSRAPGSSFPDGSVFFAQTHGIAYLESVDDSDFVVLRWPPPTRVQSGIKSNRVQKRIVDAPGYALELRSRTGQTQTIEALRAIECVDDSVKPETVVSKDIWFRLKRSHQEFCCSPAIVEAKHLAEARYRLKEKIPSTAQGSSSPTSWKYHKIQSVEGKVVEVGSLFFFSEDSQSIGPVESDAESDADDSETTLDFVPSRTNGTPCADISLLLQEVPEGSIDSVLELARWLFTTSPEYEDVFVRNPSQFAKKVKPFLDSLGTNMEAVWRSLFQLQSLLTGANFDHYCDQLERLISKASAVSKCAVVGAIGCGKSFIINCLLAATVESAAEYTSKQRQRDFAGKIVSLEALHDSHKHATAPKPLVEYGEVARTGVDPHAVQFKKLASSGKLSNAPGWILPSATNVANTSKVNVSVKYGHTFHVKISYYSESEIKGIVYDALEQAKPKGYVSGNASLREHFVDQEATPVRPPSAKEVVLKEGLTNLGKTKIYSGSGQTLLGDLLFIREILSTFMDDSNEAEQMQTKNVTLYAPCAVLSATTFVDVTGFNDTNSIRTERALMAVNNAETLMVVLNQKGLAADRNTKEMLETAVFLNQILQPQSSKKLHFLLNLEKGFVMGLEEMASKESMAHMSKLANSMEDNSRACLKDLLQGLAEGAGLPNPRNRVEAVLRDQVTFSPIFPALFTSLHLNGRRQDDAVQATGMLKLFGICLHQDQSSALSMITQLTGTGDSDSKTTEPKSEDQSVLSAVIENVKKKAAESLKEDSTEVKRVRTVACRVEANTKSEYWQVLLQTAKARSKTEFLPRWKTVVATALKRSQSILQEVYAWSPSVSERVNYALHELRLANRTALLSSVQAFKKIKLYNALFGQGVSIPSNLHQMLRADSMSLHADFVDALSRTCEAVFLGESPNATFRSVLSRNAEVFSGLANNYWDTLLSEPKDKKHSFEMSVVLSKLQRLQLTALNSLIRDQLSIWGDIKDISALRQKIHDDLKAVPDRICRDAARCWSTAASRAVKLYQQLLFGPVGRPLKMPASVGERQECLLLSAVRSVVKEAQAVGTARENDPTVPATKTVDQLGKLEQALKEWMAQAKTTQSKVRAEIASPRFAERLGQTLLSRTEFPNSLKYGSANKSASPSFTAATPSPKAAGARRGRLSLTSDPQSDVGDEQDDGESLLKKQKRPLAAGAHPADIDVEMSKGHWFVS